MNYRLRLLVLALALQSLVLTVGCTGTEIRTEAIRGSTIRVLDRHDAYVTADTASLSKDADLRQSKRVRVMLEGESIAGAALASELEPCLDRHDVYVEADEGLAPVEKRTFLRSTLILRQTLKEARRR